MMGTKPQPQQGKAQQGENRVRPRYHSGGILVEGSCYIHRPADEELFDSLLRGEYCYVLAPPRSGKSSLRARTGGRLRERGVRCVNLDLSKMGAAVSQDGFYYALIGQLSEGLSLADPTSFFSRHARQLSGQRWSLYLRDEVLPTLQATNTRLVVFVDEVDATRAVHGGADDFFAALRGVFHDREGNELAQRLTFCLIGSHAPEELVRDPALVPLDIARLIELQDFTPQEASGFLSGLEEQGDGQRTLDRVLWWTDGHPFMTQQLCEGLVREPGTFGVGEDRVDRLVDQYYLRGGGVGATFLFTARRRFEESKDPTRLPAISLYRRLLYGERLPAQREDRVQLRLRFAGLIKQTRDEAGRRWLKVRNRVYEQVLSRSWIEGLSQGQLLESEVAAWLGASKRADLLLRGAALQEALRLLHPGTCPPEVDEFLRASLAVEQEEQLHVVQGELAEERRAQKAARERQRRERRVILGASAALLGCATLGLFGFAGRARRAEEARAAFAAQAAETARTAASETRRADRTHALLRRTFARLGQVAEPAPPAQPGQPEPTAGGFSVGWGALEGGLREDGAAPPAAQAPRGPGEEVVDGLMLLSLAQQPGQRTRALSAGICAAAAAGTAKRAATRTDARGEPNPQAAGASVAAARSLLSRGICAVVTESLAVRPPAPTSAPPATPARPSPVPPSRASMDGAPDFATLAGHMGQVRVVAAAADGRILTASDDHTARLWDAASGRLLSVLRGHTDLLRAAAFSPDGTSVVTAANDRSARLWHVPDGKPIATLAGHTTEVTSAVFSPDGRRVVTAAGDDTVRIWDARTGQPQQVLRGHRRSALLARFSPDGARVLSAGQDGQALIFDAQSGKLLFALQGHEGSIGVAEYAPRGAGLLTAGSDGTVRIWDADGRPRLVLRGHEGAVTAASFSPDGRLVISAGADRTARLWDLASCPSAAASVAAAPGPAVAVCQRPAQVLRGHEATLAAASFSPDGTQVLTAGWDRTARLWDLAGTPLMTLRGHSGAVFSATYTGDGQHVLTASADRTARIFPATVSGCVQAAARLLGTTLEAAVASCAAPAAK